MAFEGGLVGSVGLGRPAACLFAALSFLWRCFQQLGRLLQLFPRENYARHAPPFVLGDNCNVTRPRIHPYEKGLRLLG